MPDEQGRAIGQSEGLPPIRADQIDEWLAVREEMAKVITQEAVNATIERALVGQGAGVRTAVDTRACWHAAEHLAGQYPNLRVVDDHAVMPLSTAMWLRVVLCVVDAYEDR